jgi:hypothetical protein
MDQPKSANKTKTRSPAYPAIGLEEAIAKADLIYQIEHEHFANIEAIASHWETTVTNGNFQTALAALKQFGLIVDEGKNEDRRAQLTDLAKDILEHPGDSPKRQELLRTAALTPKIHRELWEKYKGKLPQEDVSIRFYLVRERDGSRFNPNHVDSFIAQFRSTIAFAKLTESDIITPADEGADKKTAAHFGRRPPARPAGNAWETVLPHPGQKRRPTMPEGNIPAGTIEANLPVDAGAVYIAWPDNIGEDEIEDVESWLQMMVRKMRRSASQAAKDQPSEHDEKDEE